MAIIRFIVTILYELVVVLWNIALDFTKTFGDFLKFIFIGYIIPIGFASFLWWIEISMREPSGQIDATTPIIFTIIAIVFMVHVTKEALKLKKSDDV